MLWSEFSGAGLRLQSGESSMSAKIVQLDTLIAGFSASPLAARASLLPWELTQQSEAIIRQLLGTLVGSEFVIAGEIAVHLTAVVEGGATLKGPLIVGPRCFVASGAYLRGGNWVAERCTLGPGSELKSSFLFPGTTLAHFNFVGDSILGAGVNLEAGSIICNHRNERANKEVLVRSGGRLHPIGCDKFGAVVGDGCRVGANAVLAPGAVLPAGTIVARASLRDDELPSSIADV
jgi:NDP-sugar pyrophosphorylase family protein